MIRLCLATGHFCSVPTAMMTAHLARILSCTGMVLCLGTTPALAEIYKWVDANGRTHYSERQEDPGRARKVELPATRQASQATPTASNAEYWQDQERQFQQRQIQKSNNEKRIEAAAATKPKSLSGGIEDGTDASRCNLARDVLSGAVRHTNGKPIDRYDIEVAQNDVRRFCR